MQPLSPRQASTAGSRWRRSTRISGGCGISWITTAAQKPSRDFCSSRRAKFMAIRPARRFRRARAIAVTSPASGRALAMTSPSASAKRFATSSPKNTARRSLSRARSIIMVRGCVSRIGACRPISRAPCSKGRISSFCRMEPDADLLLCVRCRYRVLLCLLHRKFDAFNIGTETPEIMVRELAEIYRKAAQELRGYLARCNTAKAKIRSI